MAFLAYISIKGKKQGQFKGEALTENRADNWMPVLGFFMGLKSPRDAASGQASGRRQFKPVTISKAWGAASPQALTACSTNEVLTEVVIDFLRTNANGEEYVHQTVKLTDATLIEITRSAGDTGPTDGGEDWRLSPAAEAPALEQWSFTFRKIEVEDKDGKTTYSDQ